MNPRHMKPWSMPTQLQTELDTIFRRTQMPTAGREYVLHSIAQGPSRQVQAGLGNTCVRHVSKKMGATMMLESRRGESALAWQLESAPTVTAYFPQPGKLTLDIKRADGSRATTVPYTPDFLVVEDGSLCIKEVRDTARFWADSKRSPDRYFRDADGKYRNLPAEEAFKARGLKYELIVTGDLPARLVENMRFLEDYHREDCPPLTDEERQSVVDRVAADRWVPLRTLLDEGLRADVIYKAIAEGAVHVPLETTRVADTDSVKLYSDPDTARMHAAIGTLASEPPPPIPGTLMLRSGSTLTIHGRDYHVLVQGERDVLLHDPLGMTISKSVDEIRLLHEAGHADGEAFRLPASRLALWTAPPHKIDKAMRRLRAVRDPHQSEYSKRSVERFAERIKGASSDMHAVELLIDEEDQRGNRTARLSELNEELIQKAIEQHYNTPDRLTAKGAYEKYKAVAEATKEPDGSFVAPVSMQTFSRRCNELKSTKAREGKRAAYQKGRIVPLLGNEHPAHGLRPHEVLYVDHTIADIETRSPQGMLLRKPTLTVGVDGCTRHARAFVLLYEPPSVRAVMLLLRMYIARHKRVPRVLVVDNGKEFHSHELELLCRLYGIELRYRAPGMPRGGALIERSFGAINQEVLAELAGNSRAMKRDARLITGQMQPMNRAVWTLTALHGVISTYLYEEHAGRVHPELGTSPNAYEEQRMAETGAREHLIVQLDENAMLLTSPHPQRRAKRKVVAGRGVNVYGIYYQHPAMQKVPPGTSVEVRVEWWNASVVYVHIDGRWVTAVGTSSRFLSERGNREIEMAYREHVRQAGEKARKDGQERAGRTFRSVKLLPEHFDPLLAAQQDEVRRLYQGLGPVGSTARPAQRGPAANDGAEQPATPSATASDPGLSGTAPEGAAAASDGREVPTPAPHLAPQTTVPVPPSANDDRSDDDDDFLPVLGGAPGLR